MGVPTGEADVTVEWTGENVDVVHVDQMVVKAWAVIAVAMGVFACATLSAKLWNWEKRR